MELFVLLMMLFSIVCVFSGTVPVPCTDDYVDENCQFWKCDLTRIPHQLIPTCSQNQVYSNKMAACVEKNSADDDCSNVRARTFVEQYCIQDKINENCEFLKCANGQFTTMPPCPTGLSYGKTRGNFGCLLAGHPDACIPQHGFVTTITGVIAQPICIQDIINEDCEFMKCDNGHYIKMPACPSGLTYGNTNWGIACLLPSNPMACSPKNGLVTDKITTDPCNPNPCKHVGNCLSSQTAYICVCKPNYIGSNCEINELSGNKCSSTPCLNGGTCKQTFDDRGYACTCPVDVNGFTYTGDNCELQSQSMINPCSGLPCKNGGTCIQPTNNGYICKCPIGYTGNNCELDSQGLSTGCDSTTCQNGGTCYSTTGGGYFCACGISVDGSKTYKGTNCEIEVPTQNSCASNPCLFGGTCTNSNVSPYYTCQCVQSSTGKTYGGFRCETELTSSGITDQCQNSVTSRIADPEECQRYYDCSLVYAVIPTNFKQHLDECPYPQLFNDVTKQCDNFTEVNCGDRTVYVDGCDYTKNKPSPGHTIPCSQLYPSCKNKPDGDHEHPGKPETPYYITCFDSRMVAISTCELDSNGMAQIFNETLRACVGFCYKHGNGFHADQANIRRYIQCENGTATSHDCGPSFQFNDSVDACMFIG